MRMVTPKVVEGGVSLAYIMVNKLGSIIIIDHWRPYCYCYIQAEHGTTHQDDRAGAPVQGGIASLGTRSDVLHDALPFTRADCGRDPQGEQGRYCGSQVVSTRGDDEQRIWYRVVRELLSDFQGDGGRRDGVEFAR